MDIKNFILKNKRIVICLIIALVIGIATGSSYMPKAEYNNLVLQKEQLDNNIAELDSQLEESKKQVEELQVKKDEADRIAKAEVERKAKEEAEAKAEVERKAKEEAKAKAEAEKIAQEKQNSNNYVSSGNNGGSIQKETPIGTMVWLSATGKKYHSINNCGKMDPSKARQVTLESAQSQGFTACSKCY